ncbi:MAG: hypothetical protein ACE5H0_08120, partial [Bacteroidota bacterium]
LMIAGSVVSVVKLPIFESSVLVDMGFWVYILLATFPFFFAGLTIAGIFQDFAERSSLLYGADLLGAGLGALTIVPLLDAVGGVNAALLTASVAALGAITLGWSNSRFQTFGFVSGIVAGVLFLMGWQSGLLSEVPIGKDVNKDMYRMLTDPMEQAEILESRWSAFGRTDLVRSALTPNDMMLFVDGAAGSPMYNLDSLASDPLQTVHLGCQFGEFFPFHFLKENEKENALIIGPGGGRDVVVALLGGVRSITAVEVNPEVVQIVKDYENFNGGIYTRLPNVEVVVAEGRNFLRSIDTKYDLIMLALPVTKSSRSVDGYALTENYLFTVEAFDDYLDHLTPEGRIVIVAHTDVEIYRLMSLALTAFGKRNVTEADAMKHIYTIASGMMPTVVIKNLPFDSLEVEKRHQMIHRLAFDGGSFFMPYIRQVTLGSDERLGIDGGWRMFDQILVDISSADLTLEQLTDRVSSDIRPVTDDSPFFYNFKPGLPKPFGAFSVLIVVAAGGLAMLLRVPQNPGVSSNSFRKALSLAPELKIFVLIFFSLGVGFMVIEIALFQKLTLFIGQPLLALTVLLFSLLLGTGLGSLSSSLVRKNLGRAITVTSLIVAMLSVVYTLRFADAFAIGLDSKIAASLILLPVGFVLGFPFPVSLRLMKEYTLGDHVHLMWGLNGIASVLGSALAMIVGILLGFSYAIYLGGGFYAGVAVLSVFLYRLKPSQVSDVTIASPLLSERR